MAIPYTFQNLSGDQPAVYLDVDFAWVNDVSNATGVLPAAHGGSGSANAGVVTAYTADQTLTGAQTGGVFTNLGAVGTVIMTLPTPVVGYEFNFVVAAAQSLVINVGGSVVIAMGALSSTAGGQADSADTYSTVTLKAISTTLWVAIGQNGSWNLS